MGVLDAVADPVRLRIVRHLAENGSATLSELAEAAGVHLNTIRAHVAALSALDDMTPHARDTSLTRRTK